MSRSTLPGTILITGGLLFRPEAPRPEQNDLLIEKGVITAIGEAARARAAQLDGVETLDATGSLIVPGMINAHYHSHDVLAKGSLEEENLETWALLALPPSFPPRSGEELRVRTMLGALECLRGGITTVQDMVTLSPADPEQLEIVAQAYDDLGIRAAIGPQYADLAGIATRPFWADEVPTDLHHLLKSFAEPDPDFDLLAHLEDRYFSRAVNDSRITWVLAPTAPESCSEPLLRRTMELSARYDIPVFSHFLESKSMAVHARQTLAEHGGSAVRWLESLGFSGPRVNLAHSVWLTPDEVDALAENGTRVILNPLSNLKLKSGVPPIDQYQESGVALALGCDNPSCSDVQNMFQAMKLMATLNAITGHERRSSQAEQAFEAATVGGAQALGRDDLGGLEVGQRGDVSLLALDDPAWLPLNNALRQLVYAESGRAVHTVLVDGEVVIRDGRSTRVDEAELRDRLAAVMPEFDRDYAVARDRVARLRDHLDSASRRVAQTDLGIDRMLTGR